VKDLRLEIDGALATLVIDRPQARNALALQTMRELDVVLGSIHESGARVLVICGASARAFCAGGDLRELEHMGAFARTWADPAHWDAVANLERRRRDR
jgi:enoyl-CoA hydratase/carnithine racemase